jgi:hypothetical protein
MNTNPQMEIIPFNTERSTTWSKHIIKTYWQDVVDQFSDLNIVSDRDALKLFSLTKQNIGPDAIRETNQWGEYIKYGSSNCVGSYAFVLDIDNEPEPSEPVRKPLQTIKQVSKLLKDYEFLLYPSWNHRQVDYFWLEDEKKWSGKIKVAAGTGVERFRVILPFSTLCPIEKWEDIVRGNGFEAVMSGAADESLKIAQKWWTPGWSNEVEVFDEPIYNKGSFLDWTTLAQQKEIKRVYRPIDLSNTSLGGAGKLILKTLDFNRFVSDIGLNPTNKPGWNTCTCPIGGHSGGNDTMDFKITDDGYQVSCKHMGHGKFGNKEFLEWALKQYGEEGLRPYCNTLEEPEDILVTKLANLKIKKKKEGNKTKQNVEPDFVFDEPLVVEAFDRKKRETLLRKGYKAWLLGNKPNMMLYAFEGFGKSRVVNILRDDKKQVVFGCSSNAQVIEQRDRYIAEGYRVQAITGRVFNLQQMGLSKYIVLSDPTSPWDEGTVNESRTVKKLVGSGYSQEQAKDIWAASAGEEPDFQNYDVILTTHARILVWGRSQSSPWTGKKDFVVEDSKRIIPKETIVILDDVNAPDFMWLKDFNNNFVNKKVDGKTLQTKDVDKRIYFIKPVGLRLGYGIDNKIIFTTTEMLTNHLIDRAFDIFEPELMPAQKMIAGNISLFKTSMTSAKQDGLLLPMFERIKKEGFEFNAIGDGLGLDLNHSNNKGQNCFQDKDLVVEISQTLHNTIILILNELGWSSSHAFAVQQILALDKLHQAIGRNSGYRWADKPEADKKSVVVLCDTKLFKGILEHSRYYIEHHEDLDAFEYRKFRTRPKNCLADCVAWYIQNYSQYVTSQGSRSYIKDCEDAVKGQVGVVPDRSQQRANRLVCAINSLLKKKLAPDYEKALYKIMDKSSFLITD